MTDELTTFDRSRIERTVWRNLGVKSVREIAEEAGIKPDQVLRIKNEMLSGIDVLTIDEMRAKAIADLNELAIKAREMVDAGLDDRALAPLLSASTQATKTVLNELRNMEKNSQADVNRLNDLRVRELVTLMRETVDASVREIASRVDGMTEDEMFDVFNANLTAAAASLQARNEL